MRSFTVIASLKLWRDHGWRQISSRAGEKAIVRCAALAAFALAVAPSLLADPRPPSEHLTFADAGMARAWRALRALDCARCHGKGYEGLAAPSIVNFARTQSREMFVRAVLDGDPPRGMPGYRGNPWIAENIDDIYRYFLGRADGSIDATSRPHER